MERTISRGGEALRELVRLGEEVALERGAIDTEEHGHGRVVRHREELLRGHEARSLEALGDLVHGEALGQHHAVGAHGAAREPLEHLVRGERGGQRVLAGAERVAAPA